MPSGQTAEGVSLAVSDAAATQMRGLRGSGERLPGETRGFFESRLGWDLQSVRIHADAQAAQTADRLGARAFTIGDDIVFGAGEYRPGSVSGRHLLAHELAHVLQQRRSTVPLRVQRKCRAPKTPFDLGTSDIGTAIKAGISKVGSYDLATDTRVPKVDPALVLRALASSNCFLTDAAALQSKFTVAGAKPTLRFNYHDDENTGHSFSRGTGPNPSVISVRVVDAATVITKTVHEVVHASHAPVRARRATLKSGAVTQVERAVIGEERKTRVREHEILREIADANPALGVEPPEKKPTAESVRASFVSGRPQLTYQEDAILGEMKRRVGKAGLDAAGAQTIAERWVRMRDVPEPTKANLGRFSISDATVRPHRARATSTLPSLAPSVKEARACVRKVRAYPEWKPRLSMTRDAPAVYRVSKAGREKLDATCTAFLERYWRHIDRYEPTTTEGLRDFYWRLTADMRGARRRDEIWQEDSEAFVKWLNGAIKRGAREAEALHFLEWHLIEQAFSAEWIASGLPEPSKVIRRRHLDFLTARLGKKKLVKGISRPK